MAYRKTMIFDEKNKEIVDFLETCGRKQGILTILALKEFIEKYQLDDKNADEIKNFINSYEYIKAATMNMPSGITAFVPQPYREESLTPFTPKKEEIDDVKNNLNAMASLFGA